MGPVVFGQTRQRIYLVATTRGVGNYPLLHAQSTLVEYFNDQGAEHVPTTVIKPVWAPQGRPVTAQ